MAKVIRFEQQQQPPQQHLGTHALTFLISYKNSQIIFRTHPKINFEKSKYQKKNRRKKNENEKFARISDEKHNIALCSIQKLRRYTKKCRPIFSKTFFFLSSTCNNLSSCSFFLFNFVRLILQMFCFFQACQINNNLITVIDSHNLFCVCIQKFVYACHIHSFNNFFLAF